MGFANKLEAAPVVPTKNLCLANFYFINDIRRLAIAAFARDNWPPRFKRVRAPDISELENLVQLISQRVGRCLERQGYWQVNVSRTQKSATRS